VLGFAVGVSWATLALRMSIFPLNNLRGVRIARGFGVVCATADIPNVMEIADAMTPTNILRMLNTLQFNRYSPLFK
jgi:hypothetical protein